MNSRIVIISTLMLLFCFPAFAQRNVDTTSYVLNVQSALETKKTGATFTLLGGLALITGVTLDNNTDSNVGAGISIAGLVVTAIGIPTWIIGANNHKKYTMKAQAITVHLKVTPQQSGLTFRYRF